MKTIIILIVIIAAIFASCNKDEQPVPNSMCDQFGQAGNCQVVICPDDPSAEASFTYEYHDVFVCSSNTYSAFEVTPGDYRLSSGSYYPSAGMYCDFFYVTFLSSASNIHCETGEIKVRADIVKHTAIGSTVVATLVDTLINLGNKTYDTDLDSIWSVYADPNLEGYSAPEEPVLMSCDIKHPDYELPIVHLEDGDTLDLIVSISVTTRDGNSSYVWTDPSNGNPISARLSFWGLSGIGLSHL